MLKELKPLKSFSPFVTSEKAARFLRGTNYAWPLQLVCLPTIGCVGTRPRGIKMSGLVIFLAAELMQPGLIMAALTRNLKRRCVLQSISAKNTRQL